ncbi:hypothetical protein [Paraprevotella xylaniphila]|jgi:plasmid maintenance system killer protein|uniref:hypothetical protein n=1 Tax=Paraprevotella xylaniphila TaxID=454155 RepID=UPI0024A95648|nr:hypothetical protein [Paraprevotella xylaniphila]
MLNIEYKDEELKLFIETGKSNDKRYKKLKSNAVFMRDLRMVINLMRPVDNVKELHMFKKLNYEPLHYDYEGYSSVRIGFTSKYRLIFEEFENGIRICLIEISEHYGDK